MSDLVKRLNTANLLPANVVSWRDLVSEAADEIERLQAENAKLRKALQDFYDYGYDRSECKLVLDPKEPDK